MDNMHACHFYTFPMAKKRKEKASKRLVYPNTLSHTSPQNIHHTYIHKKMLFQVYYMCYVFAFKIMFLFIVQFEAHGKVTTYGGVHLCKLHVCHFISWG
jgi:hypothetical protein